MGGLGSSRWHGATTRATITSALALELAPLKALWAHPEASSGVLRWPRKEGPSPEMGYALTATAPAPDGWHAYRRLDLTCRVSTRQDSGPGDSVRLTVELVAQPMPMGGRRWWYLCPACGHRRASLYLVRPRGAWGFRCRCCARLVYPSQQETPEERTFRAVRKLSRRLGVKVTDALDSYTMPLRPRRPTGMRRATYGRLLPRWQAALAAHCGEMTTSLRRLARRLGTAHSRQGGL